MKIGKTRYELLEEILEYLQTLDNKELTKKYWLNTLAF